VNRLALARAICEAGRRLAARGLIAGGEGNIGVRLDGGRVLVTPRGRSKGELTPEDLVEVDLEGRVLRGRTPSTEVRMHLTVLRGRPDVQAVVHAHPPVATGFATAGLSVDCDCIPEILATVGHVPLVPYGMTGTSELSEQLGPYLAGHDALLLANHGAVTFGASLDQALQRMESLEQAARVLFVSRLLGGPVRLAPEDIARLEALRAPGPGRTP
jgi:L-fuculose-phosphate aldolase